MADLKNFTQEDIAAMEKTVCEHMITAEQCVDVIKIAGLLADWMSFSGMKKMLLDKLSSLGWNRGEE